MSYLHRVLCPLAFLTIAVLLLFGGLDAAPVCGQTKDVQGAASESVLSPSDLLTPPLVRSDAFTLPLDRMAKRKLEAAEDYIGEKDWKEAALMIQYVLDLKEDSFFLLPADPKRHLLSRSTSTRAAAERLLGSLPPAGREFYQIINEPLPRKCSRKPTMLIIRNFLPRPSAAFFTPRAVPRPSSNSHLLSRPRGCTLAALAFQRRLERAGQEPEIAPLTLFKTCSRFTRPVTRPVNRKCGTG